jgi:hypothetical protein
MTARSWLTLSAVSRVTLDGPNTPGQNGSCRDQAVGPRTPMLAPFTRKDPSRSPGCRPPNGPVFDSLVKVTERYVTDKAEVGAVGFRHITEFLQEL